VCNSRLLLVSTLVFVCADCDGGCDGVARVPVDGVVLYLDPQSPVNPTLQSLHDF
jgi:hypothetical protein